MKLALMVDVPSANPDNSYVRVPHGPYEKTLTLAAEMGFDGVEIMIDRPETIEIEALQSALSQTGLTVAAVNSGRLYFEYGLGLISEVAEIRSASREALLALARATAPLDAPINLGVFRGLPAEGQEQAAADELVVILQETADMVSSLGVMLVLEPSNHLEYPFIYSTTEGMALVNQVDRPNVSLMLDTFHMSVEKENFVEAFSAAMPMLHHIHFLDPLRNPPSSDSLDFDLTGALRVLSQHHYQHFISMPMLHSGETAATAEVVSTLKKALHTLTMQS